MCVSHVIVFYVVLVRGPKLGRWRVLGSDGAFGTEKRWLMDSCTTLFLFVCSLEMEKGEEEERVRME